MNTKAGNLCRCPENRRVGDWSQVRVREQGSESLDDECKRPSMEGDCSKTFEFNSVTVVPEDEESMKLAIMYGGPITASIHTYNDPDLLHHDERREKVFMGAAEGTTASSGHAIVIFGWGETGRRQKYWLARNTWGKKWPKNAETPGIFKIHRGSNRNEIESGETVFSLVSKIPSVGNVQRAFSNACEGMVPEVNEALRCISVNNDDPFKCVLKNTCSDKNVKILKTTSNAVVKEDDSRRDSCGMQLPPSGIEIGPREVYDIPGLADCCVLKAELMDGPATCLELKIEERCEIKNNCRDPIQVKFRQGRMTTSITGAFNAGRESSVDMKFCGDDHEMLTFDMRDRPVNVKRCFTRQVGGICVGTNRCGKVMRAKILSGGGNSRVVDFDSTAPTIVSKDFCKPGVMTEEV